jgi:hypothetical protein
VLGEVGGVGHLVVGLDGGDEALGHHRVSRQFDVGRVELHLGGVVGVGHRVVANGRAHVGSDADTVLLDAVSEIIGGRLPQRWHRPQPIADEGHTLAGHLVLRRREAGLYLRRLGAQAVLRERLGRRLHLRVVQAQLLLEADELEQPSGDPHQRVRLLVDRVELVLEADDALRIVEGPRLDLRRELLPLGRHPLVELRVVHREHLAHPFGELRGRHVRPWVGWTQKDPGCPRRTVKCPARARSLMRQLATFNTGPDGTLVLAPTPGDEADYEDLEVSLSGRTIEITTPEGGEAVALEVVHGDLAD